MAGGFGVASLQDHARNPATGLGARERSNPDPGRRQGMIIALALLANDIAIHEKDLSETYGLALAHLDSLAPPRP